MSRVDDLLQEHAPWAMSDQRWPLTPFERFMWSDDRPRFPLVFQVDLCFDGLLDTATMQEAFRFAIGRHPLLRSTIAGAGRDVAWVAPSHGWPELGVFAENASDEPRLKAIDLTREPGLRGWMRETAVGWDIKLLFHHACCDGQGARMFIQDMVLAYALLRGVSQHRSPFFALDVSHLDRRGNYPAAVGRAKTFKWKLQNFVQFFLRGPQPTFRDAAGDASRATSDQQQEGSEEKIGVGFCSHTFTADEAAQLQDPQRREGASLNDVAVAMLFSLIGHWQRSHGAKPNSWVRISVPCDLRGREDERMPAANRYTYVFLNRRLGDCGSWEDLLGGVQAELQERLQTRFGVNFLGHLKILANRPRLMRWVLGREFCFSTAVLTNLSDPSRRLRKRLPVDEDRFFWLDGARCHDLRVCTPPLRPKTHWGIGMFEYAGRITVTFRYDSTTISPADAQQMLDRYVESWREWLAATSDRADNAAAGHGACEPVSQP